MARLNATDWRARVSGEVKALVNVRSRRGQFFSTFHIEIPSADLLRLIVEASTRRGISPTGYLRRAAYVFLAHDLGIPVSTVFALDPRFSPEGPGRSLRDPEGKMGGPWEVS